MLSWLDSMRGGEGSGDIIRPPRATVYRFLGVGLTLDERGLGLGGGKLEEGLGLISALAGEVERGRPDTEELGVSRPDGRPENETGIDKGGEFGGEKWP